VSENDFPSRRQSSSGVEQRTHKPLVGGSNPSSGTRPYIGNIIKALAILHIARTLQSVGGLKTASCSEGIGARGSAERNFVKPGPLCAKLHCEEISLSTRFATLKDRHATVASRRAPPELLNQARCPPGAERASLRLHGSLESKHKSRGRSVSPGKPVHGGARGDARPVHEHWFVSALPVHGGARGEKRHCP
jgi:hypothetical protein